MIDHSFILDSLPDMLCVVGLGEDAEFINRRWRDYTGSSSKDGHIWQTAIHPEDVSRVLEQLHSVRTASKEMEIAARIRRADGMFDPFVLQCSLIQRDGRTSAMCLIARRSPEAQRRDGEGNFIDADFLKLLDTIPVGIEMLTPAGELEAANRHLLECLGVTPEERKRVFSPQFVHPQDMHEAKSAFEEMIATGQPSSTEQRLRTADGQYRWFQVRRQPLRDASGGIVRWCAVYVDVDERKRVEERLKETEIDLRRIINTIPTMTWTTLPDGYCDFLNERWLNYTGLAASEAEGWGWSAALHPDDSDGLIDFWQRALASGTFVDYEARIRSASGEYRWFLFRGKPLLDDTGRTVKWYGANIDIEDRKRAEALRESEQNLKRIINAIPTMAWATRGDGYCDFLHERWLEYTGLSIEEAEGWGWIKVIHPDDLDALAAHWRSCLLSGTGADAEARIRRFDGEYRWFLFRGTPVHDESGTVVRWYGANTDIEDRKRAEEALRASEVNLRKIVNTLPTTAWSTRPDGYCDFLNDRWLDYAGFTAEQAEGWAWSSVIHPDDALGLATYWKGCLASGTPVDTEARMRRFDGEYRWFIFRANPLRDEAGNIIRWYGTNIDIEDRKRADEALRSSEINLRKIINTLPTTAWTTRPDGYCDFLSDRWLDYAGFTNEDAIGWAWASVIHPDDARGLETYWRSALVNGTPVDTEARMRHFDGEYRWFLFRANPLRDEAGKIVKWYGTNIDIDDRKRAEEQLRRSETFMADAQRLSRTGSFSWKVGTQAVIWSEETYRIYELDPAMPMTLDLIRSRVHPDSLAIFAKMTGEIRSEQGDFDYETQLLMPDKSVKFIRVVAHEERNTDGEWEVRGAVQDITASRAAEEALGAARSELAHVNRITSLGALTASIAHEVNQPLSGIIMNATTCLRVLAADPPDIEAARDVARLTIRDGNRAAEVIVRLRALFGKRPARIEAVNLSEAALEVLALSTGDLQRTRIAVTTQLDDSLAPVAGDRVQLQQVILNLMRNAAEAMETIIDRQRTLTIRTDIDKEGYVRLSVRDTGIGFTAYDPQRIFHAFYTTKNDGMGIGLSVCRSIIENHKGRLWAQANEGPGATVSFSIPIYSATETDAYDSLRTIASHPGRFS